VYADVSAVDLKFLSSLCRNQAQLLRLMCKCRPGCHHKWTPSWQPPISSMDLASPTTSRKSAFQTAKSERFPVAGPPSSPGRRQTSATAFPNLPSRGATPFAIVTEKSDIYGLDVDVKDGGFEALERMLDEYDNFPVDTPRLTTGNGGLHILFSLSQSEEAGLLNCSNKTRIRYTGKAVGIDIRGKGGLLYTAPSSYTGLDGTLRRYEWDHEILPDRSNLRAVLDWLISILNDGGEAPSGSGEVLQNGNRAQYVLSVASMLYLPCCLVFLLVAVGRMEAWYMKC
jgi:hypothetical protein